MDAIKQARKRWQKEIAERLPRLDTKDLGDIHIACEAWAQQAVEGWGTTKADPPILQFVPAGDVA